MFFYPPTGKVLADHSAIRSYLSNTLFSSVITQEQLDYVGVIEIPDPVPPAAPEGKVYVLAGLEKGEGKDWLPIWEVQDAPRPAVPAQVSRRQARQALLLAGLLDQVGPAIAAIEDPVQRGLAQIEWEDSQVFERQRPVLISLAESVGLDSDRLDQLFITAAGL